jgi:hypothetical protein
MSETGGRRTPTLDTEWEDLTEDHRHRRRTIEANIEDWPSEITQASYVIGAIGAGKTQLLAHLFKYAYTEAEKPAIYITMGQLLDDIEAHEDFPTDAEVISQEKLHNLMEAVTREKCEQIHTKISEDSEFVRDDYLFDAGRITNVEEYAELLGISSTDFGKITANDDEVILIVDEMEESYNRLGEMVAQTTGPLREVVERVEGGNSAFYLIGGFGYASVHELGEAEFRRVKPVTLPIIKPQSVQTVLGDGITTEQRNFVWWMSRGRPGWLEIANNAYEMRPSGIQGSYDTLADIPNLEMARVDIIAVEELEEYVQDLSETERDQTGYTVFNPAPVQIEHISGLDVEAVESNSAPVLADSDTKKLDSITDAFLSGAHRFDEYNEAIVSDQLVRRYLVRILRGISNENDELVFGAGHVPVFQRGTICKKRVLAPLAERIHDIALEESGDGEQETIDFLYELSQYIQSTSAEELSGEFGTFFNLFSDSDDFESSSYVGPGLRTLVTAFPSLITNPRLSFAGQGQSITEQFNNLTKQLQDGPATEHKLREFGSILQEDPR